jgi:hypothetical protein
MKSRLHNILIISLCSSAAVNFGYAQDAGMQDAEVYEERIDSDKIIYSPGEADTRYRSTTSVSKDTTNTTTITSTSSSPTPAQAIPKYKAEKPAPTPKSTVEKASKEGDDSILSFNFLYYIIQKYKLQDIVD